MYASEDDPVQATGWRGRAAGQCMGETHILSERQDVRTHIVIVLLIVVLQYPRVTGSKKSFLTYLH